MARLIQVGGRASPRLAILFSKGWMTMKKSLYLRRPALEGLERRALLAGNVTAFFNSGSLLLSGDAAANGVSIEQVAGGKYVVSGFALDGSPTLINGAPYKVFSGVTNDVAVNLEGGNDLLVIGNN